MSKKNEASKLVFTTEAQSLEFTEAIGNIDAKAGINQCERDKKLAKLGKKLFKEHPVKKTPLFKITILNAITWHAKSSRRTKQWN